MVGVDNFGDWGGGREEPDLSKTGREVPQLCQRGVSICGQNSERNSIFNMLKCPNKYKHFK